MNDVVNKIEQNKRGDRDQLFDEDLKPHDFMFNEKVASVFDDMVSRSVPMYKETMAVAMDLAKHFVQDGTNVYDVGSATGTLLLSFAELIGDKNAKLIGLDNSEPMLEQSRQKAVEIGCEKDLEFRFADVEQDMKMENASVVFMNYTLQFVRPLHREAVLRQICEGLNPNGCLILVEKVLGNDSLYNRLYIDLYYEYKQRVGYSAKEIQQKREALENVLIPYRIDENVDLLQRCGFSSTDIFFKWCNFAGIVAVKA